MINVDEVFNRAYHLSVVEDRVRESIDLCRQILKNEPNHYNTRLLLGILLADHGTPEEIIESKKHFNEAILNTSDIHDLFTNKWQEEDPVYHLGLSNYKEYKNGTAALLFLIDYLFSEDEYSKELLFETLKELDPENYKTIESLIERIKKRYSILPKI